MQTDLSEAHVKRRVAELGSLVSEHLLRITVEGRPDVLYEPVRYVLAGQGKRLRPALLMLCAEMYGVACERALPAALAIEVSHNWALVHDDIMDAAQMRRGRQTVHRRWDVSTALLCGDVLLGLSLAQLTRAGPARQPLLFKVFTRMVVSLCEGQALDMAFEARTDVTTPEYLGMIDLKTGALIGAAMEMGAIFGGASLAERTTVRNAGVALGRAFQIQDDLLDLVVENDQWGKAIGGDLQEGKKTILLLEALSRAKGDDYDFFDRIQHGAGLNPDDIAGARRRMDRLGVLDYARKSVSHYTHRAIEQIRTVPQRSDVLVALMQQMAARGH